MGRASSQLLERNVLEAVDLRVVIHLHVVFGLIMMVPVFGYAAHAGAAVERGDESVQAAADGTFATQTGNVSHAGYRSTVLALGGIRVERHDAATTCKEQGKNIGQFIFQFLGGAVVTISTHAVQHQKRGSGTSDRRR